MWYEKMLHSLLIKVKVEEQKEALRFINDLASFLTKLHLTDQYPGVRFLDNLDKIVTRNIPIDARVIDWLIQVTIFPNLKKIPVITSFNHLIQKIENKYGKGLARLVFSRLQNKCEYQEILPFELVLGIVQKMHEKYGPKANASVSFVDFARDLFSLSLIYSKNVEDKGILNSYFLPFFATTSRLKILGLPHPTWQDLITSEIKGLEKQQLRQLDFSLKVNFDFIADLAYYHNSIPLVDEMINFFRLSRCCHSFPYIVEKEDYFTKFVLSLQRIKLQLEVEQYPTQNLHSFFPSTPIRSGRPASTPKPAMASRASQNVHTARPQTTQYSALFGGSFDLFSQLRSELSYNSRAQSSYSDEKGQLLEHDIAYIRQ
ncbi:hypothetical protein [Legionella cardiaca]|uniref:Uncharacterized protein n=1 Tax=Legionella cardiaca TaxID=1071983 RepID=A0ABY8ANP2_9GAMM|nr:hypothetical protein [Legionella cardiaca]WED42270.1 hypothetical protein PXX05_10060 [Legionella cardiaca]